MVFENRKQAGELLAKQLSGYSNRDDVVVLAIPRGGVIVGKEISDIIHAPLSVVVTKKIGAPDNPELAVGAVAEDGDPIFDSELVSRLDIGQSYLSEATHAVHKMIADYIQKFRKGQKLDVSGKVVIVTDDGVATGSTVEAALSWLRLQKPELIVLAIPTGASDSMEKLEKLADSSVCLDKPMWFSAVGQFYREFEQVSDEEVVRILSSST